MSWIELDFVKIIYPQNTIIIKEKIIKFNPGINNKINKRITFTLNLSLINSRVETAIEFSLYNKYKNTIEKIVNNKLMNPIITP